LRNGSSRGFTGQGPGGFRPPGALRRDCSRRKLRPDPIRSSTSCRELVATPAGEAAAADTCAVKRACPSRTRRTSPLALGSPNDPLARGHPPMTAHPEPVANRLRGPRGVARESPAQGPPPAIFREEDRDPPHPRCLPSLGSPFEDGPLDSPRSGVGPLSTGCPQAVEYWPAPLRSPRDPAALDGAAGREDSAARRLAPEMEGSASFLFE
jgi:hypothetical protein